jgi:CheY-like chemotaxis protein
MAEDEPNDVLLLQRAFRDAEILTPLYVVCDGQEAIDFLEGRGKFSDRTQFPLPSLLILDLKMPRKTGLEVLEWVRRKDGLCWLPIILFSSSAHPGDIEKSYRLGANAFVVKPLRVEARAEFARLVKGFWLNLIELPLPGVEKHIRKKHAAHS